MVNMKDGVGHEGRGQFGIATLITLDQGLTDGCLE
jgi:hypothetical protein